MTNTPTLFHGYEQQVDFDRARTQLASPFDYLDIALDSAQSNVILNVSGDFLYIDTAFDGIATIELNNEHSAPKAPFKVQAGWAINAVFKQLKFSCNAQTGKKIRLMFSTGERVVPANSAAITISNTITTIEDGYSYGASYKSATALAANTPDLIFSAAANVNGAIIQMASFNEFYAALVSGLGVYLAKSTAPTSITDGDVIVSANNASGYASQTFVAGFLNHAVKIAAGKGLYFITGVTQTTSSRSVLYTLL